MFIFIFSGMWVHAVQGGLPRYGIWHLPLHLHRTRVNLGDPDHPWIHALVHPITRGFGYFDVQPLLGMIDPTNMFQVARILGIPR